MTPIQTIHIVSFNVPYPPDYGGVIDVYFRIKGLFEKGFSIILHCFDYGRGEQTILEEYCTKVYYYSRSTAIKYQFSKIPFIVITRKNELLLKRLAADDFPVLFEGLHTCYYLDSPELLNKKKIVRMHNIEHQYYGMLGKSEKNLLLKTFLLIESLKLRRYEKILNFASKIVAVTPYEEAHFNSRYGKTVWIPSNHGQNTVECKTGTGKYVLYHGNLSVPENADAVIYIAKTIVPKLPNVQFIIAGKEPKQNIKSIVAKLKNCKLKMNLTHDEMQNMIQNAQINLLITFQPTGLKLKLLNALFLGRFCVVNPAMTSGTGLEDMCITGKNAKELCQTISNYYSKSFNNEELNVRMAHLTQNFSDTATIAKWSGLFNSTANK